MKLCPFCGYANNDDATRCRKCDGSFIQQHLPSDIPKSYWIGPEKARAIRGKALAAMILGLMVLVYWGGYGPWPVIDYPPLVHFRSWVEPLLIIGGGVVYVAGWMLSRV